MSVQNTNYGDPSAFMISLNPPDASGDPYSNNVTRPGGVPLGGGGVNPNTVLNKILGYSQTDTMESAAPADVKAFLAGFNIGIQLFQNSLSPEQQIQLQTDNLDPANPAASIIMKYVKLSDDALKAGNLAGTSVTTTELRDTQATNNVQGTENAAATEKTHATSPKGNPWLAGNAYTQFVVSYFALVAILKDMKAIDSQLEIQGMQQVYDLAKQTAETIMAAAKERAMMHIMEAVIAGVSTAVTLGLTAVSVAQTSKMAVEKDGALDPRDSSGTKTFETKADAQKYNRDLAGGKLGTVTIQQGYLPALQTGSKTMDSIVQAIFELKAAYYDALKEILQAYRTIAQQQMDRASDSFKSESDLITQVIQQLDQMRQKLFEAIAASLRR